VNSAIVDYVPGLLAAMASSGLTLAVAESLTGGLLADAVVSVPGASAVFLGGVVSYATASKAGVLGVAPELLKERGAPDPEVARAMAHGVRRLFGASISAATTGVAGPDAQDGKDPGTVFVAVAWGDVEGRDDEVRQFLFHGSRSEVRAQSVSSAIGMLTEHVARH
jgi:nicotinamide-nucleotide amidase